MNNNQSQFENADERYRRLLKAAPLNELRQLAGTLSAEKYPERFKAIREELERRDRAAEGWNSANLQMGENALSASPILPPRAVVPGAAAPTGLSPRRKKSRGVGVAMAAAIIMIALLPLAVFSFRAWRFMSIHSNALAASVIKRVVPVEDLTVVDRFFTRVSEKKHAETYEMMDDDYRKSVTRKQHEEIMERLADKYGNLERPSVESYSFSFDGAGGGSKTVDLKGSLITRDGRVSFEMKLLKSKGETSVANFSLFSYRKPESSIQEV